MENNGNHHENTDAGSTEYVATKCRITKPPPPKPAANPLQFIKVAPCPLFQKAHEQIKKVEEIKKERKEVREEAEDWQQNLDNWKSCRRKRQEQIIERVVEVKKMEQEEHDRGRRKSKTFNEMMEERGRGGRGRHKFNIPIYDDESNDLSDYGIGSSSSKTNSIKDVDTDDSCSVLDEKENQSFESPSNKETSSCSNQSQSEDELKVEAIQERRDSKTINYQSTKISAFASKFEKQDTTEQYTYEGAIQDYRSRIRSKIHVDESIFTKNQDVSKSKEFSEAQTALPKGEIFKRKGLFEVDKPVEIRNYESPTARRLSEDFANTQSIKQRLQSLEKCTDQTLTNSNNNNDSGNQVQVSTRLQNDTNKTNNNSRPVKINSISNLLEKPTLQSNVDYKKRETEWCSSPEAEMYMDNLKTFNRDLDTLYNKGNNNADDYPASISSTELTTISDREDSGIHTTDVSCSVSQADEPLEDIVEKQEPLPDKRDIEEGTTNYITTAEIETSKLEPVTVLPSPEANVSDDIEKTVELLEALRRDSSQNLDDQIVNSPKIVVEIKKPVPTPRVYESYSLEGFSDDILAPPKMKEPPKVKPPPPPPGDGGDFKRVNSTKRIKKEIYLKRSSFLGLDEPTDDQIYPDVNVDKPPDINAFLQKECKAKKLAEESKAPGILSKVESHDSGLDIDRGRLSSDTWCSSVGNSTTPSPERQDSEPTNSITSEEEEIMKKEREIIEMVEKEEKSRDIVELLAPKENQRDTLTQPQRPVVNEPYLGSESFNSPYFPKEPDYLEDQDSEVLKVEQELRQLEREELKRQRENLLFQESRVKARLNNRHSMENIFDSYPNYPDGLNYRKSMPELQNVPLDYRKSMPDMPDVPGNVMYPVATEVDVLHRKSMPDIQNTFRHNVETVDHRKSMPDIQKSAFKRPSILPGEPIRSRAYKDRLAMMKPVCGEPVITTNKPKQLSRNSMQALSAVPKNRQLMQENNWIQPRANHEKNLNTHWLIQEAELRRLSEQQKPIPPLRTWQQPRQEKHLPDSIIHTLTQRVQNKNDLMERSLLRSPSNKDVLPQHPYLGHALPMPYQPQVALEETQERILSVSGKKKCSNCSKELGRGAAMIIESLCLFYHMECFICCVCHMQLGDGRMGTDVRVRNHKLHCHNCYSSDDGIKFSCV